MRTEEGSEFVFANRGKANSCGQGARNELASSLPHHCRLLEAVSREFSAVLAIPAAELAPVDVRQEPPWYRIRA